MPEPIAYNRYLVNLLRALQELGPIDLYLFAEKRRPIHGGHLAGLNATVVSLSDNRELLWEQVVLPAALWKHRIDIYHAPADRGLPALKLCGQVLTRHGEARRYCMERLKNRELSGSLEDYIGDLTPFHGPFRAAYFWVRNHFLDYVSRHRADRIITVSETTRREMVQLSNIPERKVRVTYLAPSPEMQARVPPDAIARVRSKYGLPERYILSVGSVARIKNTRGLLYTQAALKKTGERCALVICAPATHNLDEYRRLASELSLGVDRDVFFLVRVGADLHALYQAASAFLILSWWESFSLPVVEAMATGLPIVASDSACLPEIVGDGGLLVDPRTPAQAARALRRLLNDESFRCDLAQRARCRAERFSWQKTARQTLSVYEELLSRRFGARA